MPSKKTYSISEVAAILGISDKTLRRWEAKGSINPLRTLGNQRRYSEIDIAILKQRLKKITPYLPAPSQSVSPFTKDDLIAKLGVSGQTVDRWQEMGRITPIATLGDIKQTVFVPKVEEEPVKTPPTPELLTPDSPLLTTDVPTPEFLPSEALAKDGPIPSTRGDKSPHWKRWLVPTALGAGLWNAFLAYAGYYLGSNWTEIRKYSEVIDVILVIAIIGVIVFYFYKRRNRFGEPADESPLSS